MISKSSAAERIRFLNMEWAQEWWGREWTFKNDCLLQTSGRLSGLLVHSQCFFFFFINEFHIFIKLRISFFYYLKHTLNILFYDVLEIDTIPSRSRKMEKSITFFFTFREITQKLGPNLIYPLLWISFDVMCEQLKTARIEGVLLIRWISYFHRKALNDY